jgi:peptidoglycan hydrolase CwlO-like protein
VKKFIAFFFVIATFAFGLSQTAPFVFAQTVNTDLSAKERARLQKELEQYEEELKQLNTQLGELNKQSASYQRDLELLTGQIRQAQTNIKAKGIVIQNLSKEIEKKNGVIKDLDSRIVKGQQTMAELLRQRYELDNQSLVEVVMGDKTLAEFINQAETDASINEALQALFEDIRDTKTKTAEEREALKTKQNQELDAKKAIEASERQIALKQSEKKDLLAVSKNQEAGYKAIIADKQAKAASIRAALFKLRDAAAISFEDALKYANAASKATGVRPAFILGILKQESNLGVNVGQCLLTDETTGAGKGKNTGTPFANVMKPGRDVEPFLDLTERLGIDPYTTPVSCPQSVGYGGAMGPSQFIASTWVGMESRIASALGVETPNPWNPQHAIMATAVFLRDLGAGTQTYSAEQQAAGRYYAGGNWATLGLGYASSVLSHAATFQENIDFLESVND